MYNWSFLTAKYNDNFHFGSLTDGEAGVNLKFDSNWDLLFCIYISSGIKTKKGIRSICNSNYMQ